MNGSGAGRLILSIDLELDLEHQQSGPQRQLDELTTRLVALTRAHQIPATWAVADPLHSAATDSIRAADPHHEIAVLGDQAWLGPGCGRVRLARELSRRFVTARKAGIGVTTLALRNAEQVRDLDLLLEHGVTAIRGQAADTPHEARALAVTPVRFGLWQAPAAWRMPPLPGWVPPLWLLRHEIRRTIRKGSLVHLQIDAQRLILLGDWAIHLMEKAFRYLAAKRDAGGLQIQTINHVASEALAQRAPAPSRSILRPAA